MRACSLLWLIMRSGKWLSMPHFNWAFILQVKYLPMPWCLLLEYCLKQMWFVIFHYLFLGKLNFLICLLYWQNYVQDTIRIVQFSIYASWILRAQMDYAFVRQHRHITRHYKSVVMDNQVISYQSYNFDLFSQL